MELPNHDVYDMFDTGPMLPCSVSVNMESYLWSCGRLCSSCVKVQSRGSSSKTKDLNLAGSKGREISTTMCFAQILRKMMQAARDLSGID